MVAGDAAVVLRAQDAARAVLKEASAHCGDKQGRGAAAGGTAGPGGPSPLRTAPGASPGTSGSRATVSDRALTPGAAGG